MWNITSTPVTNSSFPERFFNFTVQDMTSTAFTPFEVSSKGEHDDKVKSVTRSDLDMKSYFQIHAIIIAVMVVIGLAGNIVSLIVLARMQKKQSGVRLLKYLACFDVCILVFGYVDFAMGGEDPATTWMDFGRQCLAYISHFLGLTTYMIEIYMTVLIAVQRAIAVTSPLKHARWMTESVITKSVIVIIVFVIIFHVPFWAASRPYLYWESAINATLLSYRVVPYGGSFYSVYSTYVLFVLRTAIPLVILITANIIMIKTLFDRKRAWSSMATNQTEDKGERITAIVISITTLSVVTHVLASVVMICIPHWRFTMTYEKEVFFNSSSIIIILNAASNFIFYCAFGEKFRVELFSMCGCCKRSSTPGSSVVNISGSTQQTVAKEETSGMSGSDSNKL